MPSKTEALERIEEKRISIERHYDMNIALIKEDLEGPTVCIQEYSGVDHKNNTLYSELPYEEFLSETKTIRETLAYTLIRHMEAERQSQLAKIEEAKLHVELWDTIFSKVGLSYRAALEDNCNFQIAVNEEEKLVFLMKEK